LMLMMGFGHRSRSSAARNAEGGYGSPFSSSAASGCWSMCGWVTARAWRGPAAVVSFWSMWLFWESIPCPDWSQCAGGFCRAVFPRWPVGFCREKVVPLAPFFLPPVIFIRRVHDCSCVLGYPYVVRRPISCSFWVLGAHFLWEGIRGTLHILWYLRVNFPSFFVWMVVDHVLCTDCLSGDTWILFADVLTSFQMATNSWYLMDFPLEFMFLRLICL